MSTANFTQHNSSTVFIVEDNESDPEGFLEEYRDVVLNVTTDLKELLAKGSYSVDSDWNGWKGSEFMTVYEYDSFCGVDYTVSLKLEILSGYYAHRNLDYTVCVEMQYCECEGNVQDLEVYDEICQQTGNEGLAKIHTEHFQTRIEDIVAALEEKVDSVYEKYTTCARKIGTFSNGEAIYEAIK